MNITIITQVSQILVRLQLTVRIVKWKTCNNNNNRNNNKIIITEVIIK